MEIFFSDPWRSLQLAVSSRRIVRLVAIYHRKRLLSVTTFFAICCALRSDSPPPVPHSDRLVRQAKHGTEPSPIRVHAPFQSLFSVPGVCPGGRLVPQRIFRAPTGSPCWSESRIPGSLQADASRRPIPPRHSILPFEVHSFVSV